MAVTRTKERSSNKDLRMICTVCMKPNATKYYQSKKRKDGSTVRYMFYEHPDESPIRQCSAGEVRTIRSMADLLAPGPEFDFARLDKHLENIRIHHTGMKQSFADYCIDAREMGLTDREAWEYMYSKLKDIMPTSTLYYWGNKYLPSGTMKVTKPITNKNASKKIPMLESSESERSPIQEQTGRPGKVNQAPEDYDISELDDYDADYLREIVKMQNQSMEVTTATNKKKKYFEERKSNQESLPKPENPESIFIADKWGVDDFEIERLNTYPLAYCKKVIMYMDECFRRHDKEVWKWQRTQDRLINENKALKQENAELKKKLGIDNSIT